MKAWTVLRPVKIGAGYYQVANDFIVARTPDGWRWHRADDLGTGGEWRARRIDALLDLEAHLSLG